MKPIQRPVWAALAAAALFGGSTPFVKMLVGDISPVLLAGLLYLGSGLGLAAIRVARDKGWSSPSLPQSEWPWLAGAVISGGVVGPILLMWGLARAAATTTSLLLNLEAVFTALIAWIVFKENAGARIVSGMALIVAGGLVLSWSPAPLSHADWLGPLAIAGACLCWAIDNNLTRKVSASDAFFIASVKGLVAGCVNIGAAMALGAMLPSWPAGLSAMAIGLASYGLSLVLFVVALRGLGTARTGAYFSVAPFVGALLSIVVLGEAPVLQFWIASAFMGLGVWLHLTERHGHEHGHELLTHRHEHLHDTHHRHSHEDWDGKEPHAHEHAHEPLRHRHAHFPDVHHRHPH
ncbi:MAG: EamA family transporter [Usitatibacter sp.]